MGHGVNVSRGGRDFDRVRTRVEGGDLVSDSQA